MPRLVQFDDLGLIEFPDEFSDEQITGVLVRNKEAYRQAFREASDPEGEQNLREYAAFQGMELAEARRVVKGAELAAEQQFPETPQTEEPGTLAKMRQMMAGETAISGANVTEASRMAANDLLDAQLDDQEAKYGMLMTPIRRQQLHEHFAEIKRKRREALSQSFGFEKALRESGEAAKIVGQATPGNERLAELAGTAGSVVGPLLTSPVPGLPIAVAAAQQAGQTKNEALGIYQKWGVPEADADRLSSEDAYASGAVTGALTALVPKIPGLGGGVETALRASLSEVERLTLRRAAVQLVRAQGGEALEEGADQLLQGAWARKRYRPELTWPQALAEAGKAAAAGGVLGGAAKAPMTAVELAISRSAERVAQAGAPATAEALKLTMADLEKTQTIKPGDVIPGLQVLPPEPGELDNLSPDQPVPPPPAPPPAPAVSESDDPVSKEETKIFHQHGADALFTIQHEASNRGWTDAEYLAALQTFNNRGTSAAPLELPAQASPADVEALLEQERFKLRMEREKAVTAAEMLALREEQDSLLDRVSALPHPPSLSQSSTSGENDGYYALLERFAENLPALRLLARKTGIDAGKLGLAKTMALLRGDSAAMTEAGADPNTALGIDQILQGLGFEQDEGRGQSPANADELWSRIGDDIELRTDPNSSLADNRLNREERTLLFYNAMDSERARSATQQGGKRLTVDELNIGDKLTVQGRPLTVAGVDEDGTVHFAEAPGFGPVRFGAQRLPSGTEIVPDKNSYQPAPIEQAAVGSPFSASTGGVTVRNVMHRGLSAEEQTTVDAITAEMGNVARSLGIEPAVVVLAPLPQGSGFGVSPRNGRFGTVYADPARVAAELQTGLPLRAVIEEELLHNLGGLALFKDWQIQAHQQVKFTHYYTALHREIAAEMTPEEKAMVRGFYGAELGDDVNMAEEFVRLLLQQRRSGRVTEQNYQRAQAYLSSKAQELASRPALRRLLEALRRFWRRLTGAVAASQAAARQVQRIEALLGGQGGKVPRGTFNLAGLIKDSRREAVLRASTPDDGQGDFTSFLFGEKPNDTRSGSERAAPAVGVAQPGQPSGAPVALPTSSDPAGTTAGTPVTTGIEGSGGSEQTLTRPALGEAGIGATSAESGGRGQLFEPQTNQQIELAEDFQQRIHEGVSRYAQNMPGLTDVQRDLAQTFLLSRVLNVARAFVANGGKPPGFNLQRVLAHRAANFYDWLGAQGREGEKPTVELDATQSIDAEEEGSANAERVADEATPQQDANARAVTALERASADLSAADKELYDLSLDDQTGWQGRYAKAQGVSEGMVTQRLWLMRAKLWRAMERNGDVSGVDRPDWLRVTSAGSVNQTNLPLAPQDEARPRRLNWRQGLLRVARGRWSVTDWLGRVAETAETPALGRFIRKLAERIGVYFDRAADNHARLTKDYFEWVERTAKPERDQAHAQWREWIEIAQSRDGGLQPDAQWLLAEAFAAQASPDARFLIDWTKGLGRTMGQEMTALGVQVQMPDGTSRTFKNAGEREYPRRIAPEIQEILNDPDAKENSTEYRRMRAEMVANDPARFPDMKAADAFVTETHTNAISNGAFYAGAERARGRKLPDEFYDYTLDGFLEHVADWSVRMAQIHAFGQQLGAELPPIFQRAQDSTADSELKRSLATVWNDIAIKKPWSPVERALQGIVLPLATLRYLTSLLTSVRNLIGGLQNTAENLGYARTLAQATRGLYDASVAAAKTISSFSRGDIRLREPKMVTDGANAGTVQRSLYLASIFDFQPASGPLGKAFKLLMTPYQLVEMWNRSVNTAAAVSWLKDVQVRLVTQPNSRWSRQAKAQLQRWGFDAARQAPLLQGDPELVRKFLRAAVREKQFGYAIDQTPLLFNSSYGRLFLQFQKWGAQRQRDLARNVFGPAFIGETVDGKKVRSFLPMIRFAAGVFGQTAIVAGLAQLLFGRERRDPTWDEIYRTSTDDEKRAMQLAMARIFRDVTATGGAGLAGDYGRTFLDALSRGRSKQMINPPGLAILSDVWTATMNQVERGGDSAALWRDVKNALLERTPVYREAQDAALKHVLADTDAGRLRSAREDMAVGRALVRRWLTESGQEDRSQSGGFRKSPNSEALDRINETLMIGDAVAAARLRDEFTGGDPKKLRSLKSSVSRRAPLVASNQIGKDDEALFLEWARRRAPGKADQLERIHVRYRQAAEAAGLK